MKWVIVLDRIDIKDKPLVAYLSSRSSFYYEFPSFSLSLVDPTSAYTGCVYFVVSLHYVIVSGWRHCSKQWSSPKVLSLCPNHHSSCFGRPPRGPKSREAACHTIVQLQCLVPMDISFRLSMPWRRSDVEVLPWVYEGRSVLCWQWKEGHWPSKFNCVISLLMTDFMDQLAGHK